MEVEIRDSTIVGAGKGLVLKKGLNKDGSVSIGTMLCSYDGIRFESKVKSDEYIASQEVNDYIWMGVNDRGHNVAIDAKDSKSFMVVMPMMQ